MKRESICWALALSGLLAAEAVTKHYSFSGGYPTTSGTVSVKKVEKKAEEKTFVGRVTRVDAADVIWVTPKGGRRTKILFADADAPEQGQNFGVEAKKFVFDLVNGKDVTVRYYGRDRSGAIRGTVMLQHEQGLVDVNLTLIKNGCAWYAETARPASAKTDTARLRAYESAEADARGAKRGLWAAPNPVRPSEWRKLRRTEGKQ